MQAQETSQGASWSVPQGHPSQPASSEEVKTLWMGDLQYWMDENYLWSIFAPTGEVSSVKIIRNKITGQSEGYGFIEFVTRPAAERILQAYTGQIMPQTEQPFRLNWASFGLSERRQDVGPDFSVFVGDLASDVNDYILLDTFKAKFVTVKGAKVVMDATTGRSKGYGFVRFGSEEERDRALSEMNGQYCSTRPMRISLATPKKAVAGQTTRAPMGTVTQAGFGTIAAPVADGGDPGNTTIFVGGLDPAISDEQLKAAFSPFGELVYVKIPYGKGCGFVQYMHRGSAEEAMKALHGTVIGQQAVRLSWGRNPTAKQDAVAWPNPQQAYYQYGQYDPYGVYGATPDPNAAYYSGYYGAAYQQPAQVGYTAPNIAGYQAVQPRQAPYYAPGSNGVGEPKETESFDPSAPPNVEKMNQAYMTSNNPSRAPHLWLKPSDQVST